MRTRAARITFACLTAVSGLLCAGCDSEGVADIVFGSLQLAAGIVDVAT